MANAKIHLKPREEIRIRAGHPWVYDNEIARVEGEALPADQVEVLDARGRSLGSAFYNPASKIRARIYSTKIRPADRDYFVERLRAALDYRRKFFDPDRQSLRLVFGEADSLPGLIVDSFTGSDARLFRDGGGAGAAGGAGKARGRWLSVQFLCLGMDSRKQTILEALAEVFPSDGMVERSDAPVRKFEGLEAKVDILSGSVPGSIIMEENQLLFGVDLVEGQKTGWFLDQRSNRAAAARFAKGRKVLDAFCNAGGFGLACARAGAESVLAIDASEEAIKSVKANALRNGLEARLETSCANAFDALHDLERSGRKFGLIVLDPPAFAKNRAAIEGAKRGYKELNLRALKLLDEGGILVSCSCSHWFSPQLFAQMLEEASADSGRRLRIIEERSQDLDHPIVTGYGESRYLKCVIAQTI